MFIYKDTVDILKHALCQVCGLHTNQVLLAEVVQGYIWEILPDNKSLRKVSSNVFAYEVLYENQEQQDTQGDPKHGSIAVTY